MVPPGLEPVDGTEASASLSLWLEQPGEGGVLGLALRGGVGLPSESFLRLDVRAEIGLCAFSPTSNNVSAQWPSMVPKAGIIGLLKRTGGGGAEWRQQGQPPTKKGLGLLVF